jgi:hypothetical protein
MTIHTETKEAITADDNKKGSAKLTTQDEYPETDEDTTAPDEEEHSEEVNPGKAACFDRTTSPTLLKVARAYNWGPGTRIYDDRDNALFEVIAQGCAGMNGAGPVYEAVITEINTREPVAYVRKGMEVFRETYHIYTAYPNYDSQPITRRWEGAEGAEGRDFYALGTLRQSMFGKNYVYKRCRQGFNFERAMNASNGRIRCAAVPCMIPFLCPRWHLKFYNVDDQNNPAIIRDQRDNTLTVALGENLLEAICISYAVDRLTNPCTKEVVGMGVALGLAGGLAGGAAYGYAS